MGEIKYIVGITMAILFSIAIIGFIFNSQSDNGASVLLSNEPLMTTYNSNVSGNIETLSVTNVNDSSSAFFKSTITSGDQVSASGGQFKVGLFSLIGGVNNMFSLARDKLFGGDNSLGIFITALGGLLLFIGIRYAYKSWVGANPD